MKTEAIIQRIIFYVKKEMSSSDIITQVAKEFCVDWYVVEEIMFVK